MTVDDIMKHVDSLNSAEKERFYMKVMDGYFKEMMNNQKFMEEAFHCMADYLIKMKEMGLNVNAILADMEVGVGMKKAKAA